MSDENTVVEEVVVAEEVVVTETPKEKKTSTTKLSKKGDKMVLETQEKTEVKRNPAHEIIGQDEVKKLIKVAIDRNLPVLLVGDTGTGKTSIIKGLADDRNQDYIRYNLTGETTVDEFLGKYVLQNEQTVWEDGILLQAMKKGKWLIVDEINVALPEILFVLHSLLDDERAVLVANHQGEVISPHKDFRFFATMNPVDEYAGTKDLNKAFKSRFNMIINMQYPPSKVESKVVMLKTGVSESQANQMVDVANQIRKSKEHGEVFYTCSTRDLLQWGNLIEDLGSQKAFEVSILSKANGDSKKIAEIFKSISGQYIQMERDGVEMRIEFFVNEYKKIIEAKKELEANRDKIRQEVVQELMGKLGKGA